MQVILLERVEKLGAPGSEVSVKRGYARNWLLPQGKALLATKENRERAQKGQSKIVARDVAKKAEAETVQQKLDGKEVIIVRAAGESGQLYGSVRTQDIAEAIEQQLQIIISKKFVTLEEPVRSTGIFAVAVRLHPQVPLVVKINVAPSEDEAKRQALKRDQAQRKKEQSQKDSLEEKKETRKKTKSAKTTEETTEEENSEAAEENLEEKGKKTEKTRSKAQNEDEDNVEEKYEDNAEEESTDEEGVEEKDED